MNINPFDWNVVIVGYWNRAILTPAGVGRRLFGLEEGNPVLVEVPMNGLGPHRVKYSDLTITKPRQDVWLCMRISRNMIFLTEPEKLRFLAIESLLPETPRVLRVSTFGSESKTHPMSC